MHKVAPHDPEVAFFWKWFEGKSRELASNLENEDVIRDLDHRVSLFADGSLSWEIGPGLHAPFCLVISPGGQKVLLPITKAIISQAPQVEGWEFQPAKPPKKWSPCFSFESTTGGQITVDATKWEYLLLEYPDRLYEILIKTTGSSEITQQDKGTAAEIVVDGTLGELKRLEAVYAIEIVEEFREDLRPKASPIGVLGAHLDSLLMRGS
ncbi:MAG TPA: hypothetical protein VN673_08610 [Clostridia bacterium]|nr:hypothetical protein [Clostridia bacterium]